MLFLPAAVFVGLIPLLGIYPASAIYVFGALIWHKRRSLALPALVAIGASLALYLIFELMFQISLPRGVLGTQLGF
jgi:hypothetical protein